MTARDGLLLVDKPSGPTSHDVVQRVRRALQENKIGHCGTLDPEAVGLLVLTVGRATRLTRFLIRAPKVYEGVIRFGITTDTWDAAGEVTAVTDPGHLDEARIHDAMAGLNGEVEQPVPPFSARKIGGVKQYERARRGEEVPEATKAVTIFDFSAIGELDGDRLPFRLSCSTGTYARSLAQQLGQELGCGAHLESLRRIQVGPFRLDEAIPLAELEASGGDPQHGWVPFDRIPLPFEELVTDQGQEERIAHGQTILVRELDEARPGDWIKLLSARRELIAVGTVSELIGGGRIGVIQPKIVFRG